MAGWFSLAQSVIAAAFTIGLVIRGIVAWYVRSHDGQIDRVHQGDLLRVRVDALASSIDRLVKKGSETWSDVESKVGSLEVDLKVLERTVLLLAPRLEALERAREHDRPLGGG